MSYVVPYLELIQRIPCVATEKLCDKLKVASQRSFLFSSLVTKYVFLNRYTIGFLDKPSLYLYVAISLNQG